VIVLIAIATLVALLALGVTGEHLGTRDHSRTTWQPATSDATVPMRVRQLERDPLR
jgi:hypothetical protein